MRIESVKLENVRSYLSEQIHFPEGSLLLSGDIGSGKSTILYAIEFALFGFVGNLNGNSLLRKGKQTGSVEVALSLGNHKLIINRTLKRSRDSVSQGHGFIIMDGVKTDFTPTELKAMILELLGYPKNLLEKSKELIYRYTVYTPQEEMKAILFAGADARLNTLRKVFQIDRYKVIRDNSLIVSSSLRDKIRELYGKTGDLEEKKKQLELIAGRQQSARADLQRLAPLIVDTGRMLTSERVLINQYETRVKSFNALISQVAADKAELKEKNRALESIKAEMMLTRRQLETFQASLPDLRKVESEFGLGLVLLNHHLSGLVEEVSAGESLNAEIDRTRNSLSVVADRISKAEAVRLESEKLEKDVLSSDSCPVCRQPIALEHKLHFRNKISAGLLDSERVIKEKSAEKQELDRLLKTSREKLDKVSERYKRLADLSAVARQYAEDARESGISIPGFDNRTYEVQNVLGSLVSCRKALKDLAAAKSSIAEKTSYMDTLNERISAETALTGSLAGRISAAEIELQTHASLQSEFRAVKSRLEALQHKETQLLVEKARLEGELKTLCETESVLSAEIAKKVADKKALDRAHQLKNWIDLLFVSLMETMERAVMQKVHSKFDDLFRNWFNVLIEDEIISARLDDSFTPIVEINCYDVPLGSLSGGEKTSCAFAYRLALNRSINDVVSAIKTSDILMLDEPTDGFSPPQLEKVRDVLEQLKLSQIILVSHEPKMESFVQNVLRVVKEQHVSRVC